MSDLVRRVEMVPSSAWQQTRVVTEHKISQVMFGGHTLPVHPQGKVVCGNIRYGEVYLYIEEPQEPAPLVNIRIAGYRDGSPIPPGASYLCSVFERTDHAHLYIIGGG